MTISLSLSAHHMGRDMTSVDFESWVDFVDSKFENTNVEVGAFGFDMRGDDAIRGASEEREESIRELLSVLWEEWCAS